MKDELWTKIETDIKAFDYNKRMAHGAIFLSAISLCVAITLVLWTNLFNKNEFILANEYCTAYETLTTAAGEKSSIMLEDGTLVWLNASSSITYPEHFCDSSREISINGEVYMEVAKDPSRPFTINTARMTVQVLGTKFNVTDYIGDDSGAIILMEGSVKVELPGSEPIMLCPDERVRINSDGVVVDHVCAQDFAQWKDGYLRFRGETMEEVTRELSRFYGVDIRCSERIGSKKVSGRLVLLEDMDKVIHTFSIMYGVTVRKTEESLLLM